MFPQLKKEDFYFIGLLLIIAIVYSINLGLMPLLADEPIRALVSLEMVLNDNFIHPTLGGAPYLNKPPLFNWMITMISFKNMQFSEWHLRVLPVISFLAISILHYIISSKYVSKQIALWSSIAFLTCGRILFYDSMMGYIDPVFSLVILSNFYLILTLSKTTKYLPLFIFSYILCTIAFFLKGLPACTFQVLTLLSIFFYRKKFNKLISLSHLSGIAVFIISLSIYYYTYGSYGSIEKALLALVSQSTQRTPISTSIVETITHFLEFPFQFILDFLPFSVLILFCFNKKTIAAFKENDFVFSLMLIIAANIWLYWISAETRARYLFMFLPMFFTVVFYAFEKFKTAKTDQYIRYAVFVLTLCLGIAVTIIPFLQQFNFISNGIWITGFSVCILFVLIFIFYKKRINSILMLVLVLIVLRADFNFFILPLRKKEAPESVNKNIARELAKLTEHHHLYILFGSPVNDDILFYTTLYKGEIIYNKIERPIDGNYYIVYEELLDYFHLTPIYRFSVTHQNRTLCLAKK